LINSACSITMFVLANAESVYSCNVSHVTVEVRMSRLLYVIGLTLVASFGAAACHSGGPAGDMPQDPNPMDPPMMYRAHATTACGSQSAAAACLSVERH